MPLTSVRVSGIREGWEVGGVGRSGGGCRGLGGLEGIAGVEGFGRIWGGWKLSRTLARSCANTFTNARSQPLDSMRMSTYTRGAPQECFQDYT